MTKTFGLTISLLLMLIVAPVFAGDYIDAVNKGNEAYKNKDYKTALEQYHVAEPDIPSSPELDYNIAGALYQQGGYEEAIEKYEKALNTDDINVEARAQFNLGNTYYKTKDYVKAIESYTESLKLNPDDMDAKFNLELARKMLKEHSQAQQQQGQNGQQKQQGQQQQQQQQQQQDQQKQEQQGQKKDEGQPKQQQQQQQGDENGNKGQDSVMTEQQDMPQQQESLRGDEKKMPKEDAERILNALRDDEQGIQKKIRRTDKAPDYTGKDW